MIDLTVWNLTLPVESPPLTTAAALPKLQTTYFTSSGEKVVFWAPVSGSHTGNSDFPRSELRETSTDGKARNWLYDSGLNTLKGTLSVNQVPSTGRVVVAQIHAKNAPTPLLKVVYRYANGTGNIDLEYRVKPADVKSPVAYTVANVPLNKSFAYAIQINKQGKFTVLINNAGPQIQLAPAWYKYAFYFKAGAYTLDNVGYANEGGKVTYTRLDVSHL
ncbi:hypothetical protein ALP26_01763 [Pseudomonas savastanoi pv. glycinea]|uniref:Alginate lyase 2 domain-containing protein n=2 Tax=Pseudomonas savastanoi pv. glycinea TaxID=318 RepID=A0A3M3LCD6_PSESG|nr:polysaccharide lyase family 7 protein [Pseudomonas savastanoi]EFW84715.1 hypothetical protein PsgRace4_17838 [Pseudomonas savastanoi pv. glycinea str. race 4]EGH15966.1 hypothetical protein Pgy4_23001 [Pseudomonas savastanoi pv. glycinea str. race 4]MCQ3006001.1 polysaccharide lyase family 7 protein [Pseudomonas savastanoi]RMM97229.1 hypothetical protein ALQ67_00628 [Pseudomonas savastanoi pv. glycinea]RMN32972.1 hypothetical protein ALQ66_02868 [Pseudomonas savastanoi pv. glycinea]